MITDAAVVYRVAGNREMGGEIANNLIAQDNTRLRELLLNTTNVLNVYRAARLSDADRKLARIADRINAPVSTWYRIRRCVACWILMAGLLVDYINGNKKRRR